MIAQDSLEQRLADAYRLQTKHYNEALHVVNEDGQALEKDIWVQDLQSTLQKIAAIDERMAPDKLSWQQEARKPGSELRGILATLSTSIQMLSAAIDRRSEELARRKLRLLPVLDEFIRQRQMLSSYQQFGKMR